MKQYSLRSALALGVLSMQFGLFAQTEQQPIKHVHDHSIHHKSVVGPDGYVRCHTMEMDSVRRANNPNLPTLAQEETALQKQILKYKAQQSSSNAKKVQYTIPVIFHVFTDGSGSENVSAAQIQAQVDQLNLDYGNGAGSSYPQAADVEIDFCLAAVDESGSPLAEAGINRITSYGQGPFSNTQFEGSMKAATQWDPTKYFNVWVADLSGGLLGYAQFPNSSGLSGLNANNGSANTDGVVILYSTVGSVASPFSGGAPYNLGRTLTHEAGHWLGLRHIWGDSNCGDDFCADTPESQTANYSCVTQTTCDGQQDMVENYMDYTNDACMNTFTADQKTRMQTVMGVSPRRSSFATSTVCNSSSDPDDVGVTSVTNPSGSICAAGFTPEVTVTNFGNNSVTSFTVTYDVDGGGSQTYNWTGSLASGQSTTITLNWMSTSAGSHTFSASTSSPNGNTDTNSSNDAGSSSFDMNPTGSPVTLFIDTDCYGEETVWELYDDQANLIGTGGNNNVTTPVTATQNTQASDPGAYPNETTITEDWCLDNGCYDLIVWDAYGDGLNGSAVTGCNTDGDFHVEEAGNVIASMQTANGAFDFSETVNFCIASNGIDEMKNGEFVVYPNPSEGLFNVKMIGQIADEFTVTVLDIAGRQVLSKKSNESEFSIDLSGASSGSYTVTIETASHRMMKRVVVK